MKPVFVSFCNFFFILSTDSTRDCTTEEFKTIASKLFPHYKIDERNTVLLMKENAAIVVVDKEDAEENGTLSKPSYDFYKRSIILQSILK